MEKEITEKINCAIKVYHSLNKALIIKREIIKKRKMTVQIQTNITIWERNLIIKQQTDQQTASNRNKMPDTCQMSNKMDHNNNEWQNQRKTGNRMHGKQKYKKKRIGERPLKTCNIAVAEALKNDLAWEEARRAAKEFQDFTKFQSSLSLLVLFFTFLIKLNHVPFTHIIYSFEYSIYCAQYV